MNPLQRAAVRRKGGYFAAILALFTLSIFWRGDERRLLAVPFSTGDRAAANAVQRGANALAARTIANQAGRLELRELDEGDPEVFGTATRLALTGSRGFVVTFLWQAAIEKQKRNDFHEFEVLVNQVTRLQPHFITPWIYQSWNIAYNVSVEQDRLNDMYFYIARGIELLAEGERRNRRAPDMPYQIAFYYQNKFGVSDKVQTLRCLYQLSCLRPADRSTDPGGRLVNPDGSLNPDGFRDFCQTNPHLVRRLRDRLNCKTPDGVVDFLRDNRTVPTRYTKGGDLLPARQRFPALPAKFNAGPEEAHEDMTTGDEFSGFRAARAWFAYSLTLVPPPQTDDQGRPLPGPTPRPGTGPGEYDPMRYRVPRLPMLIIFRQGAPRAQTYQADLYQKEGWFDSTGWVIDEGVDPANQWFPRDRFPALWAQKGDAPASQEPVGKGARSSLQEWQAAAEMWRRHGEAYALRLSPERLAVLQEEARLVPSLPSDPTPAQLEDPVYRKTALARQALQFYDQNRAVTNFAYFLAAAEAEAKAGTVDARKTLWLADQAKSTVGKLEAVRLYREGLEKWKAVLVENPEFHRPDRSERTEEETYDYERAYILLAPDDPEIRKKVDQLDMVAGAVIPFGGPLAAAGPGQAREAMYAVVAERLFSPFAQPMRTNDARNGGPWVRDEVKEAARVRTGGTARSAAAPQPQPAPGQEAVPPPPPGPRR